MDKRETIVRLYILSGNLSSQRAIDNIKALSDMTSGDSFRYEIIDIEEEPEMAENDNILAAPTLIKISPEPPVRLLGDLSDLDRVCTILSLGREGN